MASISNGDSAISSTSSYVETYMDYVEALPDDLQRDISQMRELDLAYQEKLREVGRLIDVYHQRKESSFRKRCLIQIQRCLVKSQELGDEKLQHVSHMMDMVDTKSRQVEIEMESAELRSDQAPSIPLKQEMQDEQDTNQRTVEKIKTTRNRRRLHEKVSKQEQDVENPEKTPSSSDNPKPPKKKKFNRKKKKENSSPTPDIPIDPNEPTYCLCNQVSYGEMIGCDNEGCEIEWFHFQCVNLTSKPKGRWYCPKCSQERRQKKNDKNEKSEKSEK